jgi:hypothetical protein
MSLIIFYFQSILFYLLNLAHLFLPFGPVLCETHVLSPFFFGLSVILYHLSNFNFRLFCNIQIFSSLFSELSTSLSGTCSLVPYTLSSLRHIFHLVCNLYLAVICTIYLLFICTTYLYYLSILYQLINIYRFKD